MRPLIGSIMLAAVLATSGCAAARAPALPENADGEPLPAGSTSTTQAGESAACKAFAGYSLAQAAIAFAGPGQEEALTTGFTTAADQLDAELPEYATELQAVRELSLKDIGGALTAAEAAQLNEAYAPLTKWNAEHCGNPVQVNVTPSTAP